MFLVDSGGTREMLQSAQSGIFPVKFYEKNITFRGQMQPERNNNNKKEQIIPPLKVIQLCEISPKTHKKAHSGWPK